MIRFMLGFFALIVGVGLVEGDGSLLAAFGFFLAGTAVMISGLVAMNERGELQ